MEPLLAVQNLSVRYRTRPGADVFALTGVDLQIAPGEVVGVLGESGSGKSTLAVALLAVLPLNAGIDDGVVLFQGTDLLKLDADELLRLRGNRVSLIYQDPSTALHPTMRVGTQVEEVLRAHSKKNREGRRYEVRSLLEAIFGDDAERIFCSYPHQLSGGQRQRIAIAQAIACKPNLLIADEPTASLDSVTQREILGLLQKLQKELSLAVLFITHSLELLNGFANRVVVMYAGRIIEIGDTASVLRSPRHPYTQALIKCRPALELLENASRDSRIPVIPGEAPDLTAEGKGCIFEPRCPERMQICRERTPGFSSIGNECKVRCFKFGG